jgi:hypothetical protein
MEQAGLPQEGTGGACPRCLDLEDEVAALKERLRQAGLLIAVSPGPNPVPDGEA